MNGQKADSGDGGKDGGQHDYDEQCGAVSSLGRGLGDAHGVDEGVRDEVEELHISSMRKLRR